MGWLDSYKKKIVTADEAVSHVTSHSRVYVHPGCALPEVLTDALVRRANELENVEIIHLLTLGKADYTKPGMEKHFRHRAIFTGGNVREAVNQGRADYVPIFLSEIPYLFLDKILPVDVALVHVSPPDAHGFCSFGVGVECTKPAAESARMVIAQVNEHMPRTLGDCFIHINKISYVVKHDTPVLELPRVRMNEENRRIGEHAASLIDDGATLQMGIGGIPDAVLFYLKDKKDLGIHTEMFSDGVLELIDQGIINNEKKTLHAGKSVASFVLGSKPLYDYINNNPLFEFHPSHYVNDPFVIAQHDNMVAINSAIQVDLTGQVCSDSIGYQIFSGFGGQVDFIRGAARSKKGKPIIALPSTAKSGEISRIVLHLDEGAGVVTSRADVHYVVTEFGVAYLHGKSIRERTKALIEIAHPKFRDQLIHDARQRHYM